MPDYTFRFSQHPHSVVWRRDHTFEDDEAAIREGRLMLQAQADVHRVSTASIEVAGLEDGASERTLGAWRWSGQVAIWRFEEAAS